MTQIYVSCESDLDSTRDAFAGKVRRWKVRWNNNAHKPGTLIDTLDVTPKATYPAIHRVLAILLTMPATSASCERSFSSIRRMKSNMRTLCLVKDCLI
ncbi:hypothetical protein DPMN_035949 [Dreissena polymorpha]|uniref:HAT C-terminal dimerisation domain-containing protein n=1 Tax=Dreissena polymorpha TaxID=45954 RepID=A0A9D4MC14_DREPO|nr:hypothetical protein DPMN_035949 [Dreissena polymorpha]